MRNITLILSLLLIFLSSCGQTKEDNKKAFEFFNLVNKQIALGKPEQQKFIDKITSSLLAIKDNKTSAINTKELQSLFDQAKAINIERQSKLEKIAEIDKNINYKDVTMEYFKSYNGLYQIEMSRIILVFGERSEDRFDRIKDLLIPKLQIIKQKELSLKQAQKDFKTKYEETIETNSIRTNGDYEYVRLKDFTFKLVDITDGTKIELMSFSGGDFRNGEDKIYYKQFIGINKSNGDTVRILALSAIQNYDFQKALRIGTFKNILPNRSEMTTSDKEFIIFNKKQTKVEKGNYKTAFGVLEFDE